MEKKYRSYSKREIALLKKVYKEDGDRKKLANELGRSYASVVSKAKGLGLQKKRKGNIDLERAPIKQKGEPSASQIEVTHITKSERVFRPAIIKIKSMEIELPNREFTIDGVNIAW